MNSSKLFWVSILFTLIGGCSNMASITSIDSLNLKPSKPHTPDNLCGIYAQFEDWQQSAAASEQKWRIDQSISMAFIHHESGFSSTARPPRRRVFGIIPGQHLSTAYGYPQAINGTWALYKKSTGYTLAKRTNFNDAVDFVGWYNARSVRINDIASNDAYRLYLAYHEGNAGYARESFLAKPWLLDVAKNVAHQAKRYKNQLKFCLPQT